MIPDKTNQPTLSTRGPPDSILAELWEVKREINCAADYRIDALVEMAHESAERIREQWRQDGHGSGARENGSEPFAIKHNESSA